MKKLLDIMFNRVGPREPDETLPNLVLYYRNIENRGRDQIICYWNQLKRKIKTGSTQDYCKECKFYKRMSCMYGTAHDSEDCRRGHYRFEGA